MTMPNSKIQSLITNNPYRILGVFANASKKDILAKANKLKAYCKVGKSSELPLDHIEGLANAERTTLSIDTALESLDFDSDRFVASISGNARNHAGSEILSGGSYEVEYYIVTTSYSSYRHF
jgi:hypothetical protein